MINGPIDFSPLVNAIKGNKENRKILPTTEIEFQEKFYVLENQKIPPVENRCHEYSSITCSEEGVRYKNNLCKYHYYLKYIVNNKVYDLYEMKEEARISKARDKFRNGKLIPNISEYERYIKNIVSYYKPLETIEEFPLVENKLAKIYMSEEQDKHYKKYSRKLKKDLKKINRGDNVNKKKIFNSFLNVTRQISNTWKGNINTPKLKGVMKVIIQGSTSLS